MCLIAVAVEPAGPWLLVLAANRDEFHDRHAAPAAYWGDAQQVFGGRDLQGGGTWLGLRRSDGDAALRIGALTNLRPGLMPATDSPAAGDALVPPSRGRLVADYLAAEADPGTFLAALEPPPEAYAGFNLLAMQLRTTPAAAPDTAAAPLRLEACYLNNLPASRARRLPQGVHAVSNATLDVAWPKTRFLRDAMAAMLEARPAPAVAEAPAVGDASGAACADDVDDVDHFDDFDDFDGFDDADAASLERALLDALADRTPAPEADLPRTGLEPERERLLSAPFIADDHYGTRCSTVIAISRGGRVFFTERRFGPGGRRLGTVREQFALAGAGRLR